MDFRHHSAFVAELDAFVQKHCQNNMTTNLVLESVHLLLTNYFNRLCSISPKSLNRAQGFGEHEVYFYRLYIPECPHLKGKQHPKSYFYKQNGLISILCCDSHIDDYKDAKLRDTAKERLYEMLEVFKSQ